MTHRAIPLLALLTCLAVAGCSSSSPTSSTAAAAPPTKPLTAEFAPSLANIVNVTVLDREPAQNIQLVGPGGRIWGARTIDRDEVVERAGPAGRYYSPYTGDYYYPGYSPSIGMGIGVGSFGRHGGVGTGFGLGFPLGGSRPQVEVPVQRYTRSVGAVVVADPGYYRATWPDWKIRATFSGQRTMELPAPRPPGAQ